VLKTFCLSNNQNMLKVDLLGMRRSNHAQVFSRLLCAARLRNKPNEG
jgi:hypothetical protein